MPFFFTLRYHCRGWYKFVDGFTRRAVQFPYHGQPQRSMFTTSSKTLHLDSCFNFCNGFFPHSSLPSPPLPSTPHTNSCKLTILRCKPFSTPHSLKTSRVCFGGHVMKQKISFPKKDWDRHFGFWNHLWSGTFPLQKGHAFCFSKCLTSFSFFLWYPLAVSREKKKEKKKRTSLWCFVLDKAWGLRIQIKHPPELVQVSTFFFLFFWERMPGSLNNSDDEK